MELGRQSIEYPLLILLEIKEVNFIDLKPIPECLFW
jgi:hypothetical protein